MAGEMMRVRCVVDEALGFIPTHALSISLSMLFVPWLSCCFQGTRAKDSRDWQSDAKAIIHMMKLD